MVFQAAKRSEMISVFGFLLGLQDKKKGEALFFIPRLLQQNHLCCKE